MTLHLVDRPATTVVGLLIHTVPMSPDIPALWPRFMRQAGGIPDAAEPGVTYGVMQHIGSGMAQLDYMAAIEVKTAGELPTGMTRLVIPAGRYARFSYPLNKLGDGFGEIFDRLLPESPYVQAAGPYFERYGEHFCPDQPDSPVEIWLPVTRRS